MILKNNTISILREWQKDEKRVVVVPRDIEVLIEEGIRVLVEKGAGKRIGFSDEDYRRRGASIVTRVEAWRASDIIVKYKPPTSEEFELMRPQHKIFSIFHAEGNKKLVNALCEKKITAYSYEFFRSKDGYYPLAFAGGEITGKLAVLNGAYLLQNHIGGKGILLADTLGVKRPKVLIIGYGNVGGAAARIALALGCQVVIYGTNKEKMRRFQGFLGNNISCKIYSSEDLEKDLVDADLVIGAILISTYNTPPMITNKMVKSMEKGSLIIDATCGYGKGYLPSFDRHTTFENPVYEKYGILHYKIDKMPSNVPLTSSQSYSRELVPYLIKIVKKINGETFLEDYDLGKIIENGEIVHPIVINNLKLFDSIKGENK